MSFYKIFRDMPKRIPEHMNETVFRGIVLYFFLANLKMMLFIPANLDAFL